MLEIREHQLNLDKPLFQEDITDAERIPENADGTYSKQQMRSMGLGHLTYRQSTFNQDARKQFDDIYILQQYRYMIYRQNLNYITDAAVFIFLHIDKPTFSADLQSFTQILYPHVYTHLRYFFEAFRLLVENTVPEAERLGRLNQCYEFLIEIFDARYENHREGFTEVKNSIDLFKQNYFDKPIDAIPRSISDEQFSQLSDKHEALDSGLVAVSDLNEVSLLCAYADLLFSGYGAVITC